MKTKPNPLIRINQITKDFETSSGTVHILKPTSFTIEEGSFTIIYGASGSGKSTLLNILMGLDKPTTGSMLYNERDLYALDPDELANFRSHTIGMVQQTNYWVKSLTVLDNISLPMYFNGITKEAASIQAMESLRRVGLEKQANKYPYVLSGGEQQRVAMARALVQNPAYILADEPTGNLDSINGDKIIDLLRYFNEELRRTIVLVTHNLEYLPIATKLLLIQDGSVHESVGSDSKQYTDELLKQMKHRLTKWTNPKKREKHV